MRFSLLLCLLCLAGCGRQQVAGFRRVALLPIENLTPAAGGTSEAQALRLAIWESLQAQPNVFVSMAGHRRDLPELQAAFVVDGYVAPNRFQLRVNDQPVECAGTLETCADKVIAAIGGQLGVTSRPIPKVATLRALAGEGSSEELERAVTADPKFGSGWLRWAAQAQRAGGAPAGVAVLERAPLSEMPKLDETRVRVRIAELRQDQKAHAKALAALAALSPADIDLQEQAAREATALRDYPTAAAIYDRLLAISKPPQLLRQASVVAAFAGDRAKAESFGVAAQAAAPNDAAIADVLGGIAYYFADYPAAARHYAEAAELDVTYQNGLIVWKAAEAYLQAGDKAHAESFFKRYLELRTKGGMPNTLVLQGVWDWFGDQPEAAIEKWRAAAQSTERGKALFLMSLAALHGRDFATAERTRREMDPAAIESLFLRSIIDGAPPPPGLPVPPDAVAALHFFLRGEKAQAMGKLTPALEKMHPASEGQWRKLDAILRGQKPTKLTSPSPEDWLAVLLR